MTDRRYFTEQDARNLLGQRVKPRVAIIRLGLPWAAAKLVITSRDRGTVTQSAWGPTRDSYLLGVAWDRPRRNRVHRIDWYTEDEFRALLEPFMAEEAA